MTNTNADENLRIRFRHCGTIFTQRCDLRCRACCASAPYFSKPFHFDYPTAEKIIDRYFEIVEHVDKFSIGGGEPLLMEHLPQMIDRLVIYHADQVSCVEVISNGTIPLSQPLVCVRQVGSA